MPCRLCLSESIVVASHIVPEFLYEALYDERHRFIELSVTSNRRERFRQKGLRERLLCESCEQRLSVYEGCVRNLLHGGLAVTMSEDGEHLQVSGLDYSKLKLFQLSLLWRAGISTLSEFSQVQLGPHEERLRSMLDAGEPGEAWEYGCVLSALMDKDKHVEGLMVPPTHARFHTQKAYRFVVGGFVFLYVVASHPMPNFISQAFAQPDGSAVIRRQQISEMKFLMNAFNELHATGKLGKE